MNKIYETNVLSVGAMAAGFLADSQMIVLFGENAPGDLAAYCYQIKVEPVSGDVEPGGVLLIDEQEFTITAVGHMVKQNLETLGHITIAFSGEQVAELPGTLHVEKSESIQINPTSVLQIAYR